MSKQTIDGWVCSEDGIGGRSATMFGPNGIEACLAHRKDFGFSLVSEPGIKVIPAAVAEWLVGER